MRFVRKVSAYKKARTLKGGKSIFDMFLIFSGIAHFSYFLSFQQKDITTNAHAGVKLHRRLVICVI